MRRLLVPLALVGLGVGVLLSGGCTASVGSKAVRRESRPITAASSLQVSGGFKVDVKKGARASATVQTDDNLIGDVLLETNGEHLVLRWKEQLKTYEPSDGVRVELVLPELAQVRAAGESEVSVDSIVSESVTMEASGGSRIVLSELIANDVSLSLSRDSRADFDSVDVATLTGAMSGSSRLEATGTGAVVKLDLSDASQAELSNMSIAEVDLEAANQSRADLRASEKLSIDASGESQVRYSGSPKALRVVESPDSTVRPSS